MHARGDDRREEVINFIEAYRDAVGRGPRAVAALYAEPCVAADMSGVRVHLTREEAEHAFADVDAAYRARGFTRSDILGLDVQPLGSQSCLATVRWAYKGACEELLWKTTFSYNLSRHDGAWKILVQTMHDS